MRETVPSFRLYREKSRESEDFWIHCETIPERTRLHNWNISRHRQDSFFQIFCLTAGGGEIREADGTRPLAAPCAIFVPPGAVHGFSYSRDVDGLVVTALGDHLRSIAAADRQVAGFAAHTRIVRLADTDPDAAYAIGCMHRLHSELLGRAAGRMLMLEPLMMGALVSLVRIDAAPGAGVDGSRDTLRERADQLATMIAAHFREQRPVSFYADAMGLSATQLNRVSRAATGLSVNGLVALQIVEAARRDLVFTPTPVQAIAYSLGFSDPAYFNRFFRRQTGMTPGAFRGAERARLET